MNQVVLEEQEDMDWLAEVHCKIAKGYACAILHGNEDSPSRVELYARNHYKCPPTVLEPDDDGNLVVKSWGEKPKDT